MKRMLILPAAILMLASCAENSFFASGDSWIETPSAASAAPCPADVLYFVSTAVMQSRTEDGEVSYNSLLTEDDRSAMSREARYVRKFFFPDSLNFFSPFYHQFTMEAVAGLGPGERAAVVESTGEEAVEAFGHYMKHLNGGRPYILAGFSQGGMMVKAVLKHMSPRERRSLVAAYVIGNGLNREDLQCRNIVPATDAFSTGVTVSYNSVASLTPSIAPEEHIWDFVTDGAAACINPVNWRTDPEPSSLMLPWKDSLVVTVAVDTLRNVLTVTGYDDYMNVPFWPVGCMHHEDLTIYPACIRENALARVRRFLSEH